MATHERRSASETLKILALHRYWSLDWAKGPKRTVSLVAAGEYVSVLCPATKDCCLICKQDHRICRSLCEAL